MSAGVTRLFSLFRRPSIESQVLAADCGYVCISGLLKILGAPLDVDEVKEAIGQTARGLSLKQIRDGLRGLGLASEVIRFDKRRSDAYPAPGILLLSRGHYIVIRRRRGTSFEIFDPNLGWTWIPQARLSRNTDGLGIIASTSSMPRPVSPRRVAGEDWRVTAQILRHYLTSLGLFGVALAILGQLVVLALPLISKFSIDAIGQQNLQAGPMMVAIGFVLMSALSALIAVTGNLVWSHIGRRVSRSFSKAIFDHFAKQPLDWYERYRPANVQAKLSAIEAHNAFALDALRSVAATTVSVIVGVVAIFFVSPWLMAPGILALALSITLDLALNRTESERTSARLESAQRRQAFTLEAIAFLPMFARYGALKEGRHRFAVLSARAADHETKLASLRSWKTLLTGTVRACETLLFVSLAALFMSKGNYSLGLFVAAGAYKDLLAQSIGDLFQLRQRHRLLSTQKHYTRDFEATQPHAFPRPGRIKRPQIEMDNVDFRYGSLDPLVLQSFSLVVAEGDCVVLRGPSGCGKSTVARLICGLNQPTRGSVTIDGAAPDATSDGFASVLQNDRLLTGTIRDNITMFRRGTRDEDVYAALEVAGCLEFVLSLPMRLNTVVSDAQSGLSGGQRQRLLLARAALKKPSLVLLDEATASLDVETEAVVLRNFKAMGATMILIAHRPEVWRVATKVIEMEAGGILRQSICPGPVSEKSSERNKQSSFIDHGEAIS